jgi:Fe2+ transport system protein FeoA
MAATLDELPVGATGTVASLLGGRGLTSRLVALGFTPGAQVTVLQNHGRGAVIVMVRDVRVALGRGQAQKIMLAPR